MKLRLSYLPNLPHIRFLPLCCLSAGIIAPATLFAAPNPAEIRIQQDIQQRQREEQLRQMMQPETDVRLQGERDHLKDRNTIQQGVYGSNKDVIYFNPKTFRFVAVDKVGNFVTGWKLDPNSNQYINYIKNGFIK